ncbi:hypothetical protein [Sanguibacter suaedae]|uniref:Uncharacterized protein n=1 Tax=Sanguibacter suaedae TaxID=2795737 RepID=A0A934IC77_9MICO|nr:hypothetical protein [Sanguibacter suaedae]MBI9116000.1 hypothetical protein [Sanguibacter suaedae]
MNDDLHTSLDRAVDDAVAQAAPPEQVHRTVAQRIRDVRRRRPTLVIGSTLGGLALVGGTAFAAVQLVGGDERREVPDVISAPRPDAPEPSAEPTEVPTPEPLSLECGAPVDDRPVLTTPLSVESELTASGEGPWTINTQAASIIPTYLRNTTSQSLDLTLEENAGVHLVQDGVVVAEPVRGAVDAPDVTLEPDERQILLDGRVVMCDGSVDVRPGDYQAYAALEVTVVGGPWAGTNDVVGGPWAVTVPAPDPVVEAPDDGAPDAPSGGSGGGESVDEVWPEPVDEAVAFQGQNPGTTAVWFAVIPPAEATGGGDHPVLEAAQAELAALGYEVTQTPFMCQLSAYEVLGVPDPQPGEWDAWGVALFFASRADAERWVELAGMNVVGIVEGEVFCHFD